MQYFAELRSRAKEFSPPHFTGEKEFGGEGSRDGLGYKFETVELDRTTSSDYSAKKQAIGVALARNMILIRVVKKEIIYEPKNVPE